MDIKSLAQLGKVTKEVVLNDQLKVTLHTLSVSEQQRALSSIPGGVGNDVSKFPHMQQAVLVEATDSINGEQIDKNQAKEFYSELQYSVLSKIFTEYSLLSEEQDKVIDNLKKN